MSNKAEVLTGTEACVNKVGLILGVLAENLETVVARMVMGVFVDCARVSWSSKAFKTVSALLGQRLGVELHKWAGSDHNVDVAKVCGELSEMVEDTL